MSLFSTTVSVGPCFIPARKIAMPVQKPQLKSLNSSLSAPSLGAQTDYCAADMNRGIL